MADEKILDRVRKLLELSQSDLNVHEASAAAAAAQMLMSRHAIDTAMLSTDTAEEQVETDILSAVEGTQCATWRSSLAVAVCEVNNAKSYRTGPTLKIIGRPTDAAKARYIFAHVAQQLEQICRAESAERGSPGRTWSNNFKLGAAIEVARRLRAAHAQVIADMKHEANAGDTMGTGAALVLVRGGLAKLEKVKADVDLYGRIKLNLRAGTRVKSRYSRDGRDAGTRAGASIDLVPAKGALGAGARKSLHS